MQYSEFIVEKVLSNNTLSKIGQLMKHLLSIVIILCLVACAANTIKKVDTRVWVPLSCSGALQWDTCFREAQALCPKGFYIAKQNELRGSQSRTMEVACKD